MAIPKSVPVESDKEKEIKKLEDFKENEKREFLSSSDDSGESEEVKKEVKEFKEDVEVKKDKKESMPAVGKKTKAKKENKKGVIELEREYVVPLKKGVLNVPHYRRAKKAIRVLKEFMVKHMKVRDRDLKKVKIDIYLNNELWFRGIKKPANKIKVKAKKIDGLVYVELADVPEAVKYKMDWAEKQKNKVATEKTKTPKEEKEIVDADKNKDGVDDKVEEKETKKAGAEKAAKVEKAAVKTQKHTAQVKHVKKSMPVRKALKK